MDAFGIASGLVAIHTRRPDNSFLEFVRSDNPKSPIFTGFSKANGLPADMPGMTEPVTDPKAAADRIFKNISAWAPPVPAPIDVKSVNWAIERYHANWDGNQGASSRTLASGASATGDPRMVNVRIHEPLNPFIDNLPPPPYPFASVDLARAREGKALFKAKCATCHTPRQPDDLSGVEARRRSQSDDGEYQRVALRPRGAGHGGLRDLRPEQQGQARRRLVRARRATGRRGSTSTSATRRGAWPRARNGYKADMLHGIWAQAPYLHNGSVPTLGQLVCAATRPREFLRGNLNYDEALVGFEWAERPTARYGPNDTILVKEYDTTVPGKANTGHTFGCGTVPGHERPRSGRRSQGDRRPAAAIAGGSVARVSEDAVGVAERSEDATSCSPARPASSAITSRSG